MTKLATSLNFVIICRYLIKLIDFIIKDFVILLFIELRLEIKICFAATPFLSSWVSCWMQHPWKLAKLLKSEFIIDFWRLIYLICIIIRIFSPKLPFTGGVFFRILSWTSNLLLLLNDLISLLNFRFESQITFCFQLFNARIVWHASAFVWNWLTYWLKNLACFQSFC